MAASHADIVKPCKIAGFLQVGEAGDSSDKFKFLVKHNNGFVVKTKFRLHETSFLRPQTLSIGKDGSED